MSEKDLKEWEMTNEKYHDFLFVELEKRLKGLARNGYEKHIIKGSSHMSFADITLMFPFGMFTAPHRDEHHAITRELVRGFFNQHLKGETREPLEEHLEVFLVR